jgi:hypothetical protein
MPSTPRPAGAEGGHPLSHTYVYQTATHASIPQRHPLCQSCCCYSIQQRLIHVDTVHSIICLGNFSEHDHCHLLILLPKCRQQLQQPDASPFMRMLHKKRTALDAQHPSNLKQAVAKNICQAQLSSLSSCIGRRQPGEPRHCQAAE